MTDPVLTPPPVAPQPTDNKSTFNTLAFSFFAWFATFISEMQSAITWISGKSTDASGAASSAALSASQASASATSANQSKISAAASESAALTYAQAAGSSAGIPTPEPNKYLATDASATVLWSDAPVDDSKLDAQSGLATNLGQTYLDKGSISASGTAIIDVKQASIQRLEALGNITLQVNNWSTDGRSEDLELHCVNFGGKTVTWPAGNWIKSDGSYAAAVGNSGVTWQVAGTDRVLVMRDAGQLYFKVMR